MKCSLHTGKKYSLDHNLRTYDKNKWNNDGHIDYSRTHLNAVLVNKSLEQFFDEQFGDALVEYNEHNREKHPERLIGFESAADYDDCPPDQRRQRAVKAYCKEQKGKVQEVIIQLGNHDDYVELAAAYGQERADQIHAAYLTEVFERWKEKNPSLVPFCATIHFDEARDGSPHLHIDYLPIAESSRGLTRKVSMDGALKNMGFERKKQHKFAETPYKVWLRSFRTLQEQAAQEFVDRYALGFTIEPSEPSKSGHEQPQDYKLRQAEQQRKQLEQATERRKKEIKQEIEPLMSELDEYKQLKVDIDENSLEKKKLPFSKNVSVSAEQLEKVEQQAAAYVANRDDLDNIRAREAALDQSERTLKTQLQQFRKYEEQKKKEIAEKEKALVEKEEQTQAKYDQQLDLNGYVEELEHIISLKDDEISSLTNENGSLRRSNEQLNGEALNEKESVIEAYRRLTDVIQAVNMLRVEGGEYYAALSPECEDLLNALAACSEKWVVEERLPELANEMWQGGLSAEIQDKVDEISPPDLSHHHHYGL